MKSHPHVIVVLILTLVAFLALGCEPKSQVSQEQAIVEENAPAEQAPAAECASAQAQAPVVETPAPAAAVEAVKEEPAPQAPAETAAEKVQDAQPAAPAAEVKPQETVTEAPKPEPAKEAVAEAPKPEAPAPAVAPATEPAAAAVSPDEPIVTIDGTVITEGALAERINTRIEQMKKQGMPAEMVDSQRIEMRGSALDGLILETLLDNEVKKAAIPPASPEKVDAEIQKIAKMQNMSMDELAKMLESSGQTLDDMKKYFTKSLTYRDLLEVKRPEELKVTVEEAKAYYDANQRRYVLPERVRASHILISPDPNAADPNTAKADAKAKAEALLKQVKEGADFAELAKANSSCPSASSGGDLNFFGRGQMAKPFEDAAFALPVGQVSEVVETQFGYHIIKTTDKQEAKTTPFEEAEQQIMDTLKQQKENQVGSKYVGELKAQAKIVYAEGKEPKPQEPAIQGTPIN